MSNFSTAISTALKAATRLAGLTITYTTSAGSVTLTGGALQGATDFEVVIDGGLAERFTSADWLVSVADLVISGAAVTPARGDTISTTRNGATETYTVAAPEGEPVFAYLDRERTRYRIHSKQTSQT